MTTLTLPTLLPTPLTPPPLPQSPLSPDHLEQLQLAQLRSAKIRRAATVANLDASLSAIFAALTLLSCIFSLSALPLAIALSLLTLNGFRGAKKLRRLDPASPRLLALNQLALAATLITYALFSLYAAAHAPSELAAAGITDAELQKSLGNFNLEKLNWYVALALYSSLILGSLIMQSLAALYYATRKKHLTAYLNNTPAWILQLQKTQVGN